MCIRDRYWYAVVGERFGECWLLYTELLFVVMVVVPAFLFLFDGYAYTSTVLMAMDEACGDHDDDGCTYCMALLMRMDVSCGSKIK